MYNYSTDWIYKLENQRHWMHYWHQLNMLFSHLSEGDRILEIGVGTRFTSNYLKSKGYHLTTIDIDAKKKPDIVANIVDYDFPDVFDYIIAFEVFEHILFDDFQNLISRLQKVFTKKMIMSVPRNEKVWLDFQCIFPGEKTIAFQIATKRNKILSKHHHWEIDYAHYSRSFLKGIFSDSNLKIESVKKSNSLVYYTLSK
ncbi:MAG: class I SAM-dependent methyltransferase [Bacteroidales bacterium]